MFLELLKMRMFKLCLLTIAFTQSTGVTLANEELITTAQKKDGEAAPYILNYSNLTPNCALILFPGGNGIVDPRMEDGALVYKAKNNFLLRARQYFVDDEFVTATTD